MIFHTVLNNKTEIYSDWLQDTIYNLSDSTFQIPDSYSYEIIEVNEKYICRPDMLSYDIYGDTLYTDLICKLNGISNAFELNKGMLLIIPSPDCIMSFMKTVSTDEKDININDSYSNELNKPTSKIKSEKRKANESVVGDTRFKIDKNRGIVIY
jgi:hypothetical protein